MRTKGLLLLLICIAGSSIVFIALSNQRPSIQTLVTETHKQLRNFQENLKDVEEKRLVTDSKYLALLGLDGQTSTTPLSLKPQNVTVVTLIRPGSEQHAYGFVRNVSHFLPNNSIVLYSVGLNEESFQSIKTTCNSTKCNVIHFDLTPFPAHVEDDRLHVYRPLVIQTALNALGVLTWPTRHAISSLTHPKMYEYFHASAESFFFLPLIRASHIVIRNTKDIREKVMLPWVQCALTRDCICPIGAQSAGCRFNKRPQYRYSGCHAYDTSALNIVLGLHFNFDDTSYTHQERETYFNKIQSEEIMEEYAIIAKQNNVTESNSKSFVSTDR
ncbi:PREDICTED: uncharacterized protein LOC106791474 isoform X2 [Polistes canadensis]|uniref:uncharacterized protein LOC106791474 isoform X2 n=1 Tax=Polistes canadensis TaxID=91411 RepID=UPI000718ABFA|nr:PREDICTED: uncharacterized protein LOC106791474 isoform X2 [Polistes canadensis]